MAQRWDAAPGAPCKFYAEGHCANGDSCRFAHDGVIPGEMPGAEGGKTRWDSSVGAPCKFFSEGHCQNGDTCRFAHDGVIPAQVREGPVDLRAILGEGKRAGQQWDASVGSPCKFHAEGHCRNGELCRFAHDGIIPSGAGGFDGFSGGVEEGKPPQKWDASVGAPCKFYSEGHCKNGDTCRFAHDGVVPTQAMGSEPMDHQERGPGKKWDQSAGAPCKFFFEGECRNGDTCRFSHEGPGSGGLKRKADSSAFPEYENSRAKARPPLTPPGGGKGGVIDLRGLSIGKGKTKGKAPAVPKFEGYLDIAVKQALGWWNTEGGCTGQISFNVVAPHLCQFEPESAVQLMGGLENKIGTGCNYNDWIVTTCKSFGSCDP